MSITPDEIVFWQNGFFKLNSTIVMTWFVMLFLLAGSFLITRKLSSDIKISGWQSLLEIIITGMKKQMIQVGLDQTGRYMSFIGTIFLFIAFANICTIIPGYVPPTSSLSTTAALAISVFVAVPVFGIISKGFLNYLKSYLKPNPFMLPINIIGELSRTLALAVRLFGNMMSGAIIISILLSITPFIFPVFMKLLGLLTGMVQAYIFSILATVYITAATTKSEL